MNNLDIVNKAGMKDYYMLVVHFSNNDTDNYIFKTKKSAIESYQSIIREGFEVDTYRTRSELENPYLISDDQWEYISFMS